MIPVLPAGFLAEDAQDARQGGNGRPGPLSPSSWRMLNLDQEREEAVVGAGAGPPGRRDLWGGHRRYGGGFPRKAVSAGLLVVRKSSGRVECD